MNITIEDFTQADYDDYLSYSVDGYAEANVKSGRWTAEEAKTQSQEQFDKLLEDGLNSAAHTFWKVCLNGKKVGDFWFRTDPDNSDKVFVYDTRIAKEYQSQGIGTNAFSIIKQRLKALEVRTIGLHVFAHNTGAARLYERLGFEYIGHNMSYDLG